MKRVSLFDLKLQLILAFISTILLFLLAAQSSYAISSDPTNVKFRCTASGRSTLTWSPDPSAASYSLRLHKQGTTWDACASKDPDGPGNSCIDLSKSTTSYTFNTDPYGTYDVWIHSRGSDGSFSPGVRVNGLRCVPNCNLGSIPSNMKPGTTYSIPASFSSTNGELGGEIFRNNFSRITYSSFGGAGNQTKTGSITGKWTPSSSDNGVNTIYCRAWNDAIAECRPSNLVDYRYRDSTQFNCTASPVSKTVCVDGQAPDVPTKSSLSCVYSTTQNGTKRYKVGHYWGRVADVGCTGLSSSPYWSQMSTSSSFSTTLSGASNTWSSSVTNVSASTFAEGTTVYARVRSRDGLNNQSGWSATQSIKLDDNNCAPEPSTPVVQMCPGVQHCTTGSTTRFEYCGNCQGSGCSPGYRCTVSNMTCQSYPKTVFFFDELYNMPCSFLPQADLTISGPIAVTPADKVVGGSVNIKFTVKNQGQASGPGTYIYTNQSGGTSTIAGDNTCNGSTVLAPGGTCISSYNFTFPSSGSKTMSIYVDSQNKVIESNESNNKFSTTFTVAPYFTRVSLNESDALPSTYNAPKVAAYKVNTTTKITDCVADPSISGRKAYKCNNLVQGTDYTFRAIASPKNSNLPTITSQINGKAYTSTIYDLWVTYQNKAVTSPATPVSGQAIQLTVSGKKLRSPEAKLTVVGVSSALGSVSQEFALAANTTTFSKTVTIPPLAAGTYKVKISVAEGYKATIPASVLTYDAFTFTVANAPTPTPTIQTTGQLKLTMGTIKPAGWGWQTAAKGVSETSPPTKGWVDRGTAGIITLDTKVTSEYWVRLKPVTGYTTSLKLSGKEVKSVKIIPAQTVTLAGSYLSNTPTPKPPTPTPTTSYACKTDADCGYCGSNCITKGTQLTCSRIAVVGSACVCVTGKCTSVPHTATPKPPTPTNTVTASTPTPTAAQPTATATVAPPTNTSVPLPTVDDCPNFALGNATCDAEGIVNNEDYTCWRNQYLAKLKGETPSAIGNCKRVANFDSKEDGVTLLDFAIWRVNALRQSSQ